MVLLLLMSISILIWSTSDVGLVIIDYQAYPVTPHNYMGLLVLIHTFAGK